VTVCAPVTKSFIDAANRGQAKADAEAKAEADAEAEAKAKAEAEAKAKAKARTVGIIMNRTKVHRTSFNPSTRPVSGYTDAWSDDEDDIHLYSRDSWDDDDNFIEDHNGYYRMSCYPADEDAYGYDEDDYDDYGDDYGDDHMDYSEEEEEDDYDDDYGDDYGDAW
jgi:hypothetical protein